jgi:hypothetical protein
MIEKCLTLSTANMPEDADFGSIRTCPHHYGDIVFVADAAGLHIPEWFRPIYKVALEAECTLILFDRDAEPSEDFKVYDW